MPWKKIELKFSCLRIIAESYLQTRYRPMKNPNNHYSDHLDPWRDFLANRNFLCRWGSKHRNSHRPIHMLKEGKFCVSNTKFPNVWRIKLFHLILGSAYSWQYRPMKKRYRAEILRPFCSAMSAFWNCNGTLWVSIPLAWLRDALRPNTHKMWWSHSKRF